MLQNLGVVYILCLLLSCDFWRWSQAEVFTAISEIESLLVTHQRIINDLDDYIQKEHQRVSVLKKLLSRYNRELKEAMKDIPNYIGNPINAFTLIKRLTSDIRDVERSIKNGTDFKNLLIKHEKLVYPTLEDLSGAAQGILRLQETYKLSATDISEGILQGVQSEPLSSSDCYELGKVFYVEDQLKNSIVWMKEALRKYRVKPEEVYSFTEIDILEYISFSYYLIKDFRSALRWASDVLAIDPNHSRVTKNVQYYKAYLEEQEREEANNNKTKGDEQYPEKCDKCTQKKIQYERHCRGEMAIPNEVSKLLTCRYLTETHPFLRLAPIKMEQYYIKPDIFVFYDVISDEEIEAIKELSKPKLYRAVVQHPETGDRVSAPYRISKSAWLKDEEGEVVARLSRRITDFTNLDMTHAEELQVSNYGVGGQYEAHFDFMFKDQPLLKRFKGNRIATVLFYMSDVAQGGATVFTELGLTVYPIKNAAIFWYNLHPSGEGDYATLHAACPVLRGDRWVSNKWIHEGGQELIKLCDLKFQEEGFIRKLPKPVPKPSQ